MNYWTELSIEYANQKSYLDDLFQVYPTIPEGIREVDSQKWKNVVTAFNKQDNELLITALLKLNLFPIKDSYVGFLRLDKDAIQRNPATIDRICGVLYQMGLENLFERCSEPKETNRQIGPFFKRWLDKKSLGLKPVMLTEFMQNDENAILSGSDKELLDFAKANFGYAKPKGLDFIARFNKKYVLGEAKFITSKGGNQDKSFVDVITTLNTSFENVICIGIIDGIPWIKDKSTYFTEINTIYQDYNIMSALVLREFLYAI
ncbi:MAG: restriction endonuclease [Cytophagia bacterium]|nr:MAG: restriction endonuclease [Cytophagia bacterium]TAG44635.1 MAG: restriction endonuclease [Cytophagia bacterium]